MAIKVEQSGSTVSSYVDDNFFQPEKLTQQGFSEINSEILPNETSYQGKVLYDNTGFVKTSLNNQEVLGTGGASLNANSPATELIKDPRVRAMLDTIAFAEGTRGNGDYSRVVNGTVLRGYNQNLPYDRSLVGKRNVTVSDLSRHPNLLVQVRPGLNSTAAGRYQFLSSTWAGLNMPDFSPRSQDLGAIELMRRRGMLEPLLNGDFKTAINRGAPEWASLPTANGGSYYGGQGARSLQSLQNVYGNSLRQYQNGTTPTPTPNPNPPPVPSGNLQRGQRGQAVENLQNNLIKLGLMTQAQKNTGPGIFGPRTESSVKDFQRMVGLSQSGRFDNATRNAMNAVLSGDIKRGSQGDTVKALQNQLVRLGYMTQSQMNTGPGIFGPRTDAALRKFQTDNKLPVNGRFDANTFRAMENARPQTNPPTQQPPVGNGNVHEYNRWNVYSTGHQPARLADGYEDLQAHHDYTSVNYVMRGLTLNRRLEARDIVLTRPGQSNFGQVVPSPLEGKVLFAGNQNDGYGNKVVVKNERTGEIMMIGHLQSLNVRTGQNVSYGQNLGGQGSTGNSTGAHIHINADSAVIRRWVADLADGKFDGVRSRFDIGRRP